MTEDVQNWKVGSEISYLLTDRLRAAGILAVAEMALPPGEIMVGVDAVDMVGDASIEENVVLIVPLESRGGALGGRSPGMGLLAWPFRGSK